MKSVQQKEPILSLGESDHVQWLINRYDEWRASIASRCSVVLSADAILVAGFTFLLDKGIIQNTGKQVWAAGNVFIAGFVIGMLLLLISLYYATTGIANVFRSSRRAFAQNVPDRLFFHPSDVVQHCKSFDDFRAKYSNLNRSEVSDALWAELWSLVQMHHYRYQRLRRAIVLLVCSLPPFLFCTMLAILHSLSH